MKRRFTPHDNAKKNAENASLGTFKKTSANALASGLGPAKDRPTLLKVTPLLQRVIIQALTATLLSQVLQIHEPEARVPLELQQSTCGATYPGQL